MLTFARSPRRVTIVAMAVMGACLMAVPTSAAHASTTASSAPTDSFTPLFADDFDGTSINHASWAVYNNAKTAKAHLASNVVVHDGMATLQTQYNAALGRWTTAGMCLCNNKSLRQTYGEWDMRARVSAGDSRAVALLWPTVGWPPEIDFMEMGGQGTQGSRQLNTMTMHYGARAENYQIHSSESGDFTQWHTVGVQWTPGVIRYLLDGQVTRTVASPNVPKQPMWFGVQTSPEAQAAPTKPVEFDIDWVREYAYNATAPTTRTAPAVTNPPSPSFLASGTIASDAASAAMAVSVGWAAKAGSSAICQEGLTRALGAAAPVGVKLGSATVTAAADTLTVGQTVRYTAQATGCDGLASPATAGPARVYKLAQQGGCAGSWFTLVGSAAFSGGSMQETYVPGASVSFYMGQAAAIALLGERGPHKGPAKIYLDGKYVTTINNYAPTTAERRVLWTDVFPVPEAHMLTVVNVGTAGAGLGVDGLAKLTS